MKQVSLLLIPTVLLPLPLGQFNCYIASNGLSDRLWEHMEKNYPERLEKLEKFAKDD